MMSKVRGAAAALAVAVPLLGGAVLRLLLGLLADRIGARRAGLIGMALTTLPLLLGWLWVDSFRGMLVVGLLLGVAGASFAVRKRSAAASCGSPKSVAAPASRCRRTIAARSYRAEILSRHGI